MTARKTFRGEKRATKAELKKEAREIAKFVEMLLQFSHEGRFRILRALSAYFRNYNGDVK
jgi:hypothetical protein